MKKNEKKEVLAFSDLPKELSMFFMIRGIYCILGVVGVIIFALMSKLLEPTLLFCAILTIYISSQYLTYLSVVSGNYKSYTGICEKKDIKELNIKNRNIMPGQVACNLILLNKDNPGLKMIVPVGSAFDIAEGNEVIVYSKEDDIIEKTTNSFLFLNPLLVKVIKE